MLLAHRFYSSVSPFLSGPGSVALRIKADRDLVVGVIHGQHGETPDGICFRALVSPGRWAIHRMERDGAPRPENFEVRPALLRLRGQRDLYHDEAHEALAVHHHGGRGVPKRRQVRSQAANVVPLGLGEGQQIGSLQDGILALQGFECL